MESPIAIVIGVFVAVVIAGILIRFLLKRRRARAAQDWASARGWGFSPEDLYLPAQLISRPFRGNRSGKTVNVVSGPRGQFTALSAEYQYLVDSTDDHGNTTTSTAYISVAGLQLAPPRAQLVVVPRTVFGRMGKAVFRGDFTTGNEEFDSAFKVELAGNAGAQQLTPQVLDYCLANRKSPFAINGDWVFTWKKGKRNLNKVEQELQYLEGLVGRLPYVQPAQQYPAAPFPAPPAQQFPAPPAQQYPAQQYPGQPAQPGPWQ